MSLKAFHCFFITISVLLSVGCGWWGIHHFLASGNQVYLGLGIGSVICIPVLLVYGFWFLRKSKGLGGFL